jgi:hypothetical protein
LEALFGIEYCVEGAGFFFDDFFSSISCEVRRWWIFSRGAPGQPKNPLFELQEPVFLLGNRAWGGGLSVFRDDWTNKGAFRVLSAHFRIQAKVPSAVAGASFDHRLQRWQLYVYVSETRSKVFLCHLD